MAAAQAPKPAKPKVDVKGILANPLFRQVSRLVLDKALPPIRKKIGERPLLAIGSVALGLSGVIQSGILPAKVADPLTVAVAIVGILVGQLPVTPLAAPKLTPEQHAKVKVVPAKAKK